MGRRVKMKQLDEPKYFFPNSKGTSMKAPNTYERKNCIHERKPSLSLNMEIDR
jgi:hypothetical protein